MGRHGEIIDLLDELVGINSKRTVLHDKHTKFLYLRRTQTEQYGGYYRYVASFIAQRSCQTAQANALLLRHGFQDQAFELWRTMANLRDNLGSLFGEDPEKEAEKFLDSTFAEMKFLDELAKKTGSTLGIMFDGTYHDRVNNLAMDLEKEYGRGILRKDGWKKRSQSDPGHRVEEQLETELDFHYQIASKLQHGSPFSTMMGADFEMRPLRNPLEHNIEGVPLQCFLTGYVLHQTVSKFCSTTEETEHDLEEELGARSASMLQKMTTIRSW